ncbi:MAG TPA: hypothetical protein VF407_25290 [Polyangiaceae bacterium]
MFRSASALFFPSIVFVAACGNGSSLERGAPQELDLHTACVDRAAWSKSNANECSTCIAHATVPACDCTSDQPYNGVCNDVEVARTNDADCVQSVDDCVARCRPDDCDCNDACYTGHAECQAATAHAQSCILDACEAFCN